MRWIREKCVGEWNSRESDALGPFVSLFSPFGLWPLDEDNVSLRIRWCISTISMAVVGLQAIYEAYSNCGSIENNGDNIYAITYGILGLSKMVFYYKHRDILRTNIESAVDDWSSEHSESFKAIMYSCRSRYKKITKYVLTLGCVAGLMWIMKVFFVNGDVIAKSDKNVQYENGSVAFMPRFLLPATCTFNDGSQSFYWTIVIIQLFQFIIMAGVHLLCNGFFIAITSHLCAQLEILKIKFTTFPNLNNETAIRENFTILIARHTHLLKLAAHLETAFSMIVLTQIVMNTFVLNVAGLNFLVLLKKKKMLSAMANTIIMQFTLVETFVYCYIGDWLTSQGDDIALSVYDCKWYSMPTIVSKNLIFVLRRTMFPIGLTAGSFVRMTNSTFTSILSTAASYLSVLRIIIKDI